MVYTGDDPVIEIEANHFAMCLLMPEDMVRSEVRKMGGIDIADDRDFAVLAKKFQVNTCLMAMRLGQLMQSG
jgi:Zn-dependent peptidase ImmA (M78 family)